MKTKQVEIEKHSFAFDIGELVLMILKDFQTFDCEVKLCNDLGIILLLQNSGNQVFNLQIFAFVLHDELIEIVNFRVFGSKAFQD